MDDQDNPAMKDSPPETRSNDYDSLTDGLKNAVNKFQSEQTPQNFAHIVTALSDFGLSGADVWHKVADYTKRHPVRVACFAALFFFAIKGLAPVAQQRRLQQATVH